MTSQQQPTDSTPSATAEGPWEANFAANVKLRREEMRMTQTDLARAAKERGLPFHQPTIQRVEKGERPIRLNEAVVISSILRSDLSAMMSPPRTESEMGTVLTALTMSTGYMANKIKKAAADWGAHDIRWLLSVTVRLADLDKGFQEQPPLAKLGIVWFTKVLDLYDRVDSAYVRACRLGEHPQRSLADNTNEFVSINHYLNEMREVVDTLSCPELDHAKALTKHELIDLFELPGNLKSHSRQTVQQLIEQQGEERGVY